MLPVLEAVPNFSEGRDPAVVDALVAAARAAGAEVLDRTSDRDHHRSVITLVGDPATVEEAVFAAVAVAVARIDLRGHRGVHPRIGAADVLPFVPLEGARMGDAVAAAHRLSARIAGELGVPCYHYGKASDPPGRALAEIRRGGFEALVEGWPEGRRPDRTAGREGAHPTAGASCVGARALLLAWNLRIDGIPLEELRGLAGELREAGGGEVGLRTLALALPEQGIVQLSMNLEDVEARDPAAIFGRIEDRVGAAGGRITATEVIGMIPDALVLPSARDRLRLLDPDPARLLSRGVASHLARRTRRDILNLLEAIRAAGAAVPEAVRLRAERLVPLLDDAERPGQN